jgi:hypothetical protein
MRRTLPFQLGAAMVALSLGAAAATAKTVTLQEFSKQTTSTFVTSQGKPLAHTPHPRRQQGPQRCRSRS